MKEIACPENGTSRIQSLSLNFDMSVQFLQITQLHRIDTESVSDRTKLINVIRRTNSLNRKQTHQRSVRILVACKEGNGGHTKR
jgi:hypothetical protein